MKNDKQQKFTDDVHEILRDSLGEKYTSAQLLDQILDKANETEQPLDNKELNQIAKVLEGNLSTMAEALKQLQVETAE